jgi:hypothetical protein
MLVAPQGKGTKEPFSIRFFTWFGLIGPKDIIFISLFGTVMRKSFPSMVCITLIWPLLAS